MQKLGQTTPDLSFHRILYLREILKKIPPPPLTVSLIVKCSVLFDDFPKKEPFKYYLTDFFP